MARSPSVHNYYHSFLWSIINDLLSNATEVAQTGSFQSSSTTASYEQLMALETVDPIDSPLPLPFTGQYPVSATCTVQMRATNFECSWRDANPVAS